MARVRDRVPAGRRRPGRDLFLDRRPSRALLETANEGIIPRSFAKTNKHGISVKTVVVQGVIVTIWDAVLCGSMALAGGSGSSISYLTAVGLTVVIYLVGYVLFFLAYFKLVFKGKDHARVFQIFGGTAGKCIVAGLGLILTVFALVVSFFPPSQLNASSGTVYVITLMICWVISVAIPFVILRPGAITGMVGVVTSAHDCRARRPQRPQGNGRRRADSRRQALRPLARCRHARRGLRGHTPEGVMCRRTIPST